MARVVFFGSPDFAVPTLDALIDSPYKPVLVVTQPDRPAGRGRHKVPTPIKSRAQESGIEVATLASFREDSFLTRLREDRPDYFVVVAFGLIFPDHALKIAKKANINVHASLLPAYRGASPVNMAIVNGEPFTGVTTMEMVRSLDSGPIYMQSMEPVDPMENAGELSVRLAGRGASLALDTLCGIDSGGLVPTEQPTEGVSTAPRLKKEDGLIPFSGHSLSVHNHIRGMNPWPGSYTYYRGDYIKVHRAEPCDLLKRAVAPGSILKSGSEGVLVACGSGAISFKRLQARGKKPQEAADFIRGHPLETGEVLGGGK